MVRLIVRSTCVVLIAYHRSMRSKITHLVRNTSLFYTLTAGLRLSRSDRKSIYYGMMKQRLNDSPNSK